MRNEIMNYMIYVNLSKFINAHVVERDGEQGIFIPLLPNGLEISKRGNVFVQFFANATTIPSRESTHYLSLKASKKAIDTMENLGYTRMPILGNMRRAHYLTTAQRQYLDE